MKKIIFLCFLVICTACHRHDHSHNHDHDHDHSYADQDHTHGPDCDHDHDQEVGISEDNPDIIIFSEARQSKIHFETEYPLMEKFGQQIRTLAQIQSSSTDEITVSAKTSGIVLFTGKLITEGLGVNAGQNLFVISNAGLADNNVGVRFSEAQANFQNKEAAYERAKILVKEGITSQKEYLDIQQEYETAKAVYNNLTRNFDKDGQKISSDMTGYIKQLWVGNGQFVEEGQALFSVSKNKDLLLKAEVQAKYASLLSRISTATIQSMDKSRFYSLEELNGRLLSYGKSLSEDNYLIPLVFRIDNQSDFISGGFVEMYVRTESEQEVLTIPSSSLTEEQGLFFVYVQITPESYEKRNVRLGATDGIRTEIRSGLNKREKIVTKGAMSVKLAQAAGALDPHAGHVH